MKTKSWLDNEIGSKFNPNSQKLCCSPFVHTGKFWLLFEQPTRTVKPSVLPAEMSIEWPINTIKIQYIIL